MSGYEHQAVDHNASIRAERPDRNGFTDQVTVTITHGEDEPTSITMWAEDFETMAGEVRTPAPTPQPDAERVQGEVTAAVRRATRAAYARKVVAADNNWPPFDEAPMAWRQMTEDEVRAVGVDLLGDGSEIVTVLSEHATYWQRRAERPDESWFVCRCGMELETDESAVLEAFRYHLADRITYVLTGGAA